MAHETLLIEGAGGVALVTFNRPDKNAMNPKLHEDMPSALEELRYDEEVRVLVIAGAGNSFCAGMDLKEVAVKEGLEFQ
jgi:trans-feruloyl-CoA hydratase/vanillin synthase